MAELSEANQSVAKLRETMSQSSEAAQREATMATERHRQELEKCRLEIHALVSPASFGCVPCAWMREGAVLLYAEIISSSV